MNLYQLRVILYPRMMQINVMMLVYYVVLAQQSQNVYDVTIYGFLYEFIMYVFC